MSFKQTPISRFFGLHSQSIEKGTPQSTEKRNRADSDDLINDSLTSNSLGHLFDDGLENETRDRKTKALNKDNHTDDRRLHKRRRVFSGSQPCIGDSEELLGNVVVLPPKPREPSSAESMNPVPRPTSSKQRRLDSSYIRNGSKPSQKRRELDCVLIQSSPVNTGSSLQPPPCGMRSSSTTLDHPTSQEAQLRNSQLSLHSITAMDDEMGQASNTARPRRARSQKTLKEIWQSFDSDDEGPEDDVASEQSAFSPPGGGEDENAAESPTLATTEEDEGGSSEDEDDNESDMGVQPASKRKASAKSDSTGREKKTIKAHSLRNGLQTNLPPISDLDNIFMDITKKSLNLGLRRVLENLNGRPLRVATMCSGTESPLLALQLVKDSLRELAEKELAIDHVFSAEIVPYKQAYIERNFRPPIIFQDITDFESCSSDDKFEARTAFGGLARVPGDLHMLIAGTSCVDYSSLNNKQKKLEERGESGKTFLGMLAYVKRTKPNIVILENVVGKNDEPWKTMRKYFRELGYASEVVLADSKEYYLPQTRQRKYMFAVHQGITGQNGAQAVAKWKSLMTEFKRAASSPVTDFLLKPEDPQLERARADLARQDNQRFREVNWEKCRDRHKVYRSDCRLGTERPFTHWVDGGTCEVPEGGNRVWFKSKVPRVWDYLDISLLRCAMPVRGYDIRYKSRILDVSQNIDHGGEDTTPFGLTGCLTPFGDFYLTSRKGPITGYECLALQGLPIKDLSFTIETNSELQDLAGNAMSSTIVGCAILSALIATSKQLRPQNDPKVVPKIETKTEMVDQYLAPWTKENLGKVQGVANAIDLKELLQDANRSALRCQCETQLTNAQTRILSCTRCSHTVCLGCYNSRVHHFEIGKLHQDRMDPHAFQQKWRARLPLILQFSKMTSISDSHMTSILREWSKENSQATSVFNDKFFFQRFVRGTYWTVEFESDSARLVLVLSSSAEWQLYLKPASTLPSNAALRRTLEQPIGRCKFNGSFSSKQRVAWSWIQPPKSSIPVNIENLGKRTPSWRARMGIPDFLKETVPESIRVTATSEDETVSQILGIYKLQPRCGTACDNLYIRRSGIGEPAMNLFLNQTPLGPANHDSFVFARDPHAYNLSRLNTDITARVDPSWRPWGSNYPAKVKVSIPASWSSARAEEGQIISEFLPTDVRRIERSVSLTQSVATSDCKSAIASVACVLPSSKPFTISSRSVKIDDKTFWSSFSTTLHRIGVSPELRQWMPIDHLQTTSCDVCVPPSMTLKFRATKSSKGSTWTPYEDVQEAGAFERSYKDRPSVFCISTGCQDSRLEIKLGVNVGTLAHRASARLLQNGRTKIRASWRLDTGFVPSPVGQFPQFTLRSNVEDEEFTEDVGFRASFHLHPAQRRSLKWMTAMEQDSSNKFLLESYEEDVLAPMQWRAEVKAEKPVVARGGLLADDVGYGKTVTTLALISTDFARNEADLPPDMASTGSVTTGRIRIRASLIICPPQLAQQWRDEVAKFLGNQKFGFTDVLVIDSIADLNKQSIQKFRDAKIIILNWKVLEHETYLENLAALAGLPSLDKSCKGRRFQSWVEQASSRIAENVPSEDIHQAGLRSTKKPSRTWNGKPLLSMFQFHRLIVDETSYIQPTSTVFAIVVSLSAERRWILSATQPLKDFADVIQIARLLGVDLGINAIPPNASPARVKDLLAERTRAEQFHAYRESRTSAWYESIHAYCQRFLDHFARKNPVDLSKFIIEEKLAVSSLDLKHQAAHEELVEHFKWKDMDFQLPDPSDDASRAEQIRDAMQGVGSPEEALLKRALVPGKCIVKPRLGKKTRDVLTIVLNTPDEDKVLIFAPGVQIITIVEKALKDAKVFNLCIHERTKKPSEVVKDFKKNGKVLILDLAGVSSSGLNLECANHVIFLSPILAETQQEYEAKMTQAMGRAIRYGQAKPIHIYRALAIGTVDVDIIEQRERRSSALTNSPTSTQALNVSFDAEREPTRLVKLKDGSFALVPVSWLERGDIASKIANDTQAYTSLERFSARYTDVV